MEPEGYYEKLFDAKLESIKTRLNGMDKALELQSREIERRMQGLNELREEFSADRNQFVSKDVFSTFRREVDAIANRTSVLETRVVIYVALLGFVFVLIQIGLSMFK